MPDSAVVLLSSGLDSTFNLYQARQKLTVRLALTFDYGQRAAKREILAARRIADLLKIPHQVIELPWFKSFTQTSLVSEQNAVPQGADVRIDNLERSMQTARSVWVPNRNGIFLNIAAGFAEGLKAAFVVPGFNREEAATFPDNSQAFLNSLDSAWEFSTEGRVRTLCYSAALDKVGIVREGLKLGMPFASLWPCYLAGEKWCGTCESCQRFRRAVEANGLSFDELKEGVL